eukprot:scaffold40475_cov60-Phaeocystis_antarctica.AAC.2
MQHDVQNTQSVSDYFVLNEGCGEAAGDGSRLRCGPGIASTDPSQAKSERHRSWRLEARPRPPVLDGRPPLRRNWWGKARGCPSPACLQRS